jgi:tRNA pseudouridine13 synthase
MTIRRVPSDFAVRERLTAAFAGRMGEAAAGRPFAVYRLTKTSMNTVEAAQGLAKALGVKGGAVAYGGLKDKHAVTVQHVSARVEPERAVGSAEGRGWSSALVGWSSEAVSTAAVEGNGFVIVVRDLSPAAAAEMERRARLLTPRGGDGPLVVNYFGDQRFGSARHGEGFAAARLIRGDFEGALRLLIGTPARKDSGKKRAFSRELAAGGGKWGEVLERLPRCQERGAVEELARGAGFREAFSALPYQLQNLSVEAYQAHLWNAAVRRAVQHEARRSGGEVLVAEDAFGEMVFPVGEAAAAMRGMEMPLLAATTELKEPMAGAMREVLREEGIEQKDLKIPGLRRPAFDEHPRRVMVEAGEFELGRTERDEMGTRLKREVRFFLPPGVFATVVLRAMGQ